MTFESEMARRIREEPRGWTTEEAWRRYEHSSLTADERRLLTDFQESGFRYVGSFPPPDIIVGLTRRGFLEWREPRMYASRGEAVYSVTDAGRAACQQPTT